VTDYTAALGPVAPPEIGEEQIAQDQPRVRALLVKRYEQLWNWVDDQMEAAREHERPLDPRVAEIGLRVCKDEAALYRLNRAAAALEDEEDPTILAIDRAAMVAEQLTVLESKRQAAKDSADAWKNHHSKEQEAA
jgi:hypothetical protein